MKNPLVQKTTKKDEEISSILKRGGETSTSGRNLKESSSDEGDKMCLKAPYEEDIIPSIKPSYTQLFILSNHLV